MRASTSKQAGLPKGQIERMDFPRFGVWTFSNFEASVSDNYEIRLGGDIPALTINQADLATLERVEQVSDFHCVTTWTYRNVCWSGYRFRDIYEQLIQPHLSANQSIELMVFRARDKYKSSLLHEDALAEDVLLVDRLNGEALSAEHGAPLRVVAPAHYGYKNVKHLQKIEFLQKAESYKPRSPRFIEHLRARVAYEERARYLPGWFFRYLYRPLIDMTIRRMKNN